MSSNTSLILSNLDFDTHKNTLKQYLRSQDRFNDYDFEGSNMSVLLDILAYNSFHQSFYLNMIGNEMFLDTAKLRDSVVSHAKELNYVPSSFTSAKAVVDIIITSNDTSKRTVVIPKGTTFTTRFASRNFTFSTRENVIISDFVINSNNTITFTGTSIELFEGFFVNDQFTYRENDRQRMLISNKNVDISSVSVVVMEDAGANVLTYNRAQSLFDLDSTSRVFFVQGAENEQYEIVFGDGVTGRRPKDNSVINVEYRISNGQLPNGSNSFTADGAIDGEVNIVVSTVTPATGGSVSESIQSIKFNAPRHFTTQERAITTEDYENLLKLNYPEVNTASAYGGEELTPPRFGKVFVAVDLTDVDGVPEANKREYARFLKARSPVSIDPVIVDPEYTYIEVTTNVNYNLNSTTLTTADIKTLAIDAILKFAATTLNNFNRRFRFSSLVNAIDVAQAAIVSNETDIRVIKYLNPRIGVPLSSAIEFQIPLRRATFVQEGSTIQSSRFVFENNAAILQDNGSGTINVVSVNNNEVIKEVGTIDYSTGKLTLVNFTVDSFNGAQIKVYAIPLSRDVFTVNNVILNIVEEDIKLTVTGIRG